MQTLLAIVWGLIAGQGGVAPAQQSELPRYAFTVEIEGRSVGAFRQVSGLSIETELIEYRDGTNSTTWFLPGNTKYSTVKLTRAFTGDSALWDWYTSSSEGGHATRVGITITVFDRAGHAVARYKLVNAWPRKYEAPTLNAAGGDVPVETIEIAHAGLQLVPAGGTR